MIVEDEYDLHYDSQNNMSHFEYDDFDGNIVRSLEFQITVTAPPDTPGPFASILTRLCDINNSRQHRQLRDDLKHHLYDNFPTYKKNPTLKKIKTNHFYIPYLLVTSFCCHHHLWHHWPPDCQYHQEQYPQNAFQLLFLLFFESSNSFVIGRTVTAVSYSEFV